MTKPRKKINAKYTILNTFLLLILCFLFITLSLKLSTLSQVVKAQNPPTQQLPGLNPDGTPNMSCIGPFVSDYMNEIIAGAGNLEHIKLLSPAFNMTSVYFDPLVNKMGESGARFESLDGIAGNAYNAFGTPITGHVNSAMDNGYLSGKPVFLSETGNFDTTDLNLLKTELDKIKGKNGQDYIGGTLFNAFGTNLNDNNGDGVPDFQHGVLSDNDLNTVCGGPKSCGVIGVNSADFYPKSDLYYSRAAGHGMQFSLSMANGGYNSISAIMGDIRNMRSKGITPVIRIWTDGGGFEDPQTYIDLLKQINGLINAEGLNMTVYAIAGPNEPESDPWTLANCKESEERKKFEPKDVPCNQVINPEFHTLRPYPASPCDRSVVNEITETKALCANDFVVKQTIEVQAPPGFSGCTSLGGGRWSCEYKLENQQAQISVNLDEAEFPILGNTELVPNSVNPQNLLKNLARVNEYVGWYLYGTPTIAEEESRNPFFDTPSPNFIYDLVNFSGPIKKLMPLTVQFAKRIETIDEGWASKNEDAGIRHDQIVGCRISTTFQGDLPSKCYFQASLTLFAQRLTEWINPVTRIFPPEIYLAGDLKPPLEENFPVAHEFLMAYKNWRDNVACTAIFGGPFFICTPKLTSPWWSNLFSTIPFASTEDRKGALRLVDDHDEKGNLVGYGASGCDGDVSGGVVKICNAKFTRAGGPTIDQGHEILYFSHTEEVAENSEFLQKTYLPKEASGSANTSTDDKKDVGIGPGCTILETRTNAGDDLYAEYDEPSGAEPGLSGTLTYTTRFACEFIAPSLTSCQSECQGDSDINACITACMTSPTCKKDVTVSIPMKTIVPRVDEIWSRLVEGDFSVFKRFFPKFGPDAPLEKVIDIPGISQGEYIATGTNTTALAGNPTSNTPGSSAQIYFPHLGGLQEYFLNGIQTALRPRGFGEQSIAGNTPKSPGEPVIPPGTRGNGSCDLIPTGPYCGVDFLAQSQFFGSESLARTASRVCNAESGADPNVRPNKNCRGTGDYSIGLFQINLRAHDIIDPDSGERLCCEAGFEGGSCGSIGNCNIVDQDLLDRCESILTNPIKNIEKAVDIQNRLGWGQWGTYNTIPQCREP